jgi:hypothetical protein
MWLQYRLPCRHTIFQRIKDGEKLTLQDLDPRWLLDGRIDANSRYLRIQDPPEAENRRGRPKNEPIAVNWEFYLPGSGQGDAQPQDEAAPRAGRGGRRGTAGSGGRGGRGGAARGGATRRGAARGAASPRGASRSGPVRGNAAAGRLNPSIRRHLSQWELEPEVEDEPEVRRTGRERKKTARAIEAEQTAQGSRKRARGSG